MSSKYILMGLLIVVIVGLGLFWGLSGDETEPSTTPTASDQEPAPVETPTETGPADTSQPSTDPQPDDTSDQIIPVPDPDTGDDPDEPVALPR